MNGLIPAPILEASNAVLGCVLTFAALGAAWSLFQWGRAIGFRVLYVESKSTIALLCAFGGLSVRQLTLWRILHLRNHGQLEAAIWDGVPTALHVVSTVLAALGIMCWLRCTLPDAFGWGGWTVCTAAAFAFAIAMAL